MAANRPAPGAAAADLCFAELDVIYGKGTKEPAAKLLGGGGGAFPLARSYDDLFREPPKTQQAKRGETVTRWTLRALACSSLEDDGTDIVPYSKMRTTR